MNHRSLGLDTAAAKLEKVAKAGRRIHWNALVWPGGFHGHGGSP